MFYIIFFSLLKICFSQKNELTLPQIVLQKKHFKKNNPNYVVYSRKNPFNWIYSTILLSTVGVLLTALLTGLFIF